MIVLKISTTIQHQHFDRTEPTRKMWMRQLEGTSATEWKRYGNNFTASTTDLTAGSSPLENGCFYFVYE